MTMLTYGLLTARPAVLAGILICVVVLLATSPARSQSLGDTRIREVDGMRIVWVPGGSFQMGSTDQDIEDALAMCEQFRGRCSANWFVREQPAHEVSVSGFWIDSTEVTHAQFCAFLNAEGNQIEGGRAWLDINAPGCRIKQADDGFHPIAGYEDHPVAEVTWYGAAAYARWVGGRLPTEAESAYAARGPESRVFPWGNAFEGNALNFCDANCSFDTRDPSADDGYVKTAPVGSYALGASWVGVLDMAGNVWEWCADWFGEWHDVSRLKDPLGPELGSTRVCRGGAWGGDPYDVRAARRGDIRPQDSYESIGFRCVTKPRPPGS